MDVTLYGITYDKYDNEVYIPVMYFDTLKVSTVEQTTEQTSARGGLGNAEHVIWDYGKEIRISLQDALYTPAKQSLLWGGFYGLKPIKVKGVWVPTDVEIDNYGNKQYYKQVVDENWLDNNSTTVGTNWIGFYCPCDNKLKFKTYESVIKDKDFYQFDEEYDPVYVHRYNKKVKINNSDLIIEQENNQLGIFTHEYYEKAELLINNFENFENRKFKITENENKIIATESTNDYKKCHSILEYQWKQCNGQMTTTSVNKDQAFSNNIDFCIHSFEDNNNKRFLFKNQKTKEQMEHWTEYVPYHHFYKTITKKLKGLEVKKVNDKILKIPVEKTISFKVYLGTFFIVEDWNIDNTLEEPGIHLLKHKQENIGLLDNMQHKVANKNFAIDVDKNIKSYNAMKDIKYQQSYLTVYIDPKTLMPYEPNSFKFVKTDGTAVYGNFKTFKEGESYYQFVREKSEENEFKQITIKAQEYPGAFRLVGETWVRNRCGEDIHCQIEVPLCKLISNVTLDLQADGAPATVDMEFKVMRQVDGTMMKIKQYNKDDCNSRVLPIVNNDNYTISILSPKENEIYCVGQDCRISRYDETTGQYTYLRLPTNDEAAAIEQAYNTQEYEDFIKDYRDILLIQTYNNNEKDSILTKENSDDINITLSYGSDEP